MKRAALPRPAGVFVVLVGVPARSGLQLDPREVPSPLIGKPAPAFALPRLDDARADASRRDDLRGKVWVLNVWASWCVACRDEHPLLVEFAQAQAGADLRPQLQGQARRRASPGWRSFGNPYDASLFDADGRVGIDFGVYGVPETFVIDKQRRRSASSTSAR